MKFCESLRLHLVKIYFSSSIYDRIKKDERANFETKLSVIGGTLGLFTGFSIISGIEIVYYACKAMIGSRFWKKSA